MRLSKVKNLSDHTTGELDILATMTISTYSGMSTAINARRHGYSDDKELTIYYFRNFTQQVGWLAIAESPQRKEIWSFVIPKYRKQGCALKMFALLVRKLTPTQRSHKYFVHGYHHESANRFYLKVKEIYKDSMNLELLQSYYS